jgi:acyl-CoA thioester hydrolase
VSRNLLSLMPHHHPVRVYYEDTDFSGLVYHVGYLRFLERGRTEWLRTLGFEQSRWHEKDLALAVRRLEIEYKRPARMDDQLDIMTQLESLSGASLTLVQSVNRDRLCLATATVQIVALHQGKATRLPDALRQILTVT